MTETKISSAPQIVHRETVVGGGTKIAPKANPLVFSHQPRLMVGTTSFGIWAETGEGTELTVGQRHCMSLYPTEP